MDCPRDWATSNRVSGHKRARKRCTALAYRGGGSTVDAARGALPAIESLDELGRFVLTEPDVFLRYSKGPHADRGAPSVDQESGLLLPGLRVVSLRPEPWWTRDRLDWLARQLNHSIRPKEQDDDRVAWLLLGRAAGQGPDREPLVWPWTPVAWVSEKTVDEARERYRTHFEGDPGSTSG